MLGNGLALIGTAALAAATAFVLNWLALIPWRKTKSMHWTERARVLHPVRIAAVGNYWALPTVLALAEYLAWPDTSPPWALVGLAAFLGTVAGTLPLDHEMFPRIQWPDLLRQAAVACLLRFLIVFVFIGAMAFMPDKFNLEAFAIFFVVLALWIISGRGGPTGLGRLLGLFIPAPPRLQNIVNTTAAQMNVPVRHVWLMRISLAQAYAIIASRELLFTERLLEILSDDEIAAICAHELGHLSESRTARLMRSIGLLAFMPWLFFKPVLHSFGHFGFLGLLFTSVLVPLLSRNVSRKLEARADLIAKSNEATPGTTARALARLYEDGLLPAVIAKSRKTHPDLYDRLIAAGVEPDYPRPKPASPIAWQGTITSALVGMLFAYYVLRMVSFKFGGH